MRVLGIEGTAWAASAAVYDAGADPGPEPVPVPESESDPDRDPASAPAPESDPAASPSWDPDDDVLFLASDAYEPESGGIHPREAAEHMADALPALVDDALAAAARQGGAPPAAALDAVAFSRGPGLGPPLRVAATAARALAGELGLPLVGVNHMLAHLEVGRHGSGFGRPVCLNASGANAHLLAYRDGRYRMLGETMDTGVGNALDKFTRHVGWSHPGGPKVEAAAADGDYRELPYVVKGMEFSFSGLTSAAIEAYDDGAPVEDVCFSLQEHVFAMLTEVAERALALTGGDELVLGGGVGQNARLRGMLRTMCAERGAAFHAPEPRFLRDNAGMIAVLGAAMLAAGDTLSVDESTVDPDFRPDEVPVTWRDGDAAGPAGGAGGSGVGGAGDDGPFRGAEAVVETVREGGARRVRKRRLPKGYRHPALDERLRRDRTTLEARLLSEARRAGVPTPLVLDVDVPGATLTLQHVGDADLAAALSPGRARRVGGALARLHGAGLVHGDPTTRNVRVDRGAPDDGRVYLIDFGLGYHTGHVEDHAMDLHVLEGSIRGTAADPEPAVAAAEAGYRAAAGGDEGEGGSGSGTGTGTGAGTGGDGETVIDRLRGIEGRGRYR